MQRVIFDRSVCEIPKWRACTEADKMDVSITVAVQGVSSPPTHTRFPASKKLTDGHAPSGCIRWPQSPSCLAYTKENDEFIPELKRWQQPGSRLCSWLYITLTCSSEALPGEEGRTALRDIHTFVQGVSHELLQHLPEAMGKEVIKDLRPEETL